jgi:hypothetical protein
MSIDIEGTDYLMVQKKMTNYMLTNSKHNGQHIIFSISKKKSENIILVYNAHHFFRKQLTKLHVDIK